MDELLTSKELARYLQLPLSGVYDLTHQRRIPFIKIGSRLRFRQSDVEKWLERQTASPKEATVDPFK